MIQVLVNLLIIRFKQIYREILKIGILRIAVLLVLSSILLVFLFIQASMLPNAAYASTAILLLIFMLHIKRGDKLFLRISFNSCNWIYFIEYTLVTFPFLIFLIIHGYWYLTLSMVFGLGIIVQLNFKVHRMPCNTRIQRWIPSSCFEWKSGVRSTFVIMVCTWLVGLVFSFFVGTVPIAMVVLGIISLKFLEKGEPYQMVVAYEKAPNKFLLLKIRQQVALLTIVCMPLLLSFLVFHYSLWYISVVILLMFSILQVYAIFIKYSFYEPNSKSSAAQIFISLGMLSFVVPVLLPVFFLLMLRFYFKAKQNLNFYLNDFH